MEPQVPAVEAPPGAYPAATAPPAPCWRCGTLPEDRYQEYCLECGVRLARYYPPTSFWSRETWARESPAWQWVMLLLLLLVALIATAVVAATAANDEGPRRPRAAAPGPTTETLDIITDLTTAPVPTAPTFTQTTIPTTTAATTGTTTTGTTGTTGTTTTNASGTVTWPPSKSGYTIVLKSVPTSQGRSQADTAAQDAIDAGLAEVGVLDSTNFSSLNPGWYVVFSGIHDTETEAKNRLSAVRAAGYPTAYVRDIRP